MSAKILLVDDSSTTLLMEQMLFTQYTKYGLILARDGHEAIQKAVAEQPDLILMDVIMPKMDGFSACREMRKLEKLQRVPIILVTSRGERRNVEMGFASGCNDYLTKPIDGHELLEVVSAYLGGQKGE
jgi:DNA-binding response OmpR family regulator